RWTMDRSPASCARWIAPVSPMSATAVTGGSLTTAVSRRGEEEMEEAREDLLRACSSDAVVRRIREGTVEVNSAPPGCDHSGFSEETGHIELIGRVRPVVDGKFLTRGGQRLRVRGVTYGPFAPTADGEPFPQPDR